MPPVRSRHDLLEEIDAECGVLTALFDRVPPVVWTSSRVNSGGWLLKDVLTHIAEWAQRCEDNCAQGAGSTEMATPYPGIKWNETRQANHAIYLKRRGHSLARVMSDIRAGHDKLLQLARAMSEADLLEVGRFAWCGKTWSVGKYIRANTAAHYRWASKHFKRWLKQNPSVDPSKWNRRGK